MTRRRCSAPPSPAYPASPAPLSSSGPTKYSPLEWHPCYGAWVLRVYGSTDPGRMPECSEAEILIVSGPWLCHVTQSVPIGRGVESFDERCRNADVLSLQYCGCGLVQKFFCVVNKAHGCVVEDALVRIVQMRCIVHQANTADHGGQLPWSNGKPSRQTSPYYFLEGMQIQH